MIEQTLHTVKIDFEIYLTFWDLSITNIVRNVLLSWVGKSYGRMRMTCILLRKGIFVSEGKVRLSLKRLDPASHQIRHETAGIWFNPKCYNTDYFGHRVNNDKNEKLKMFAVTHVIARDGYSGNDCGRLYDVC